ncbi:MAG: hypothetical protein WAV50_00850 [Minisyncoccia bacterium]
MWGRVSSEGRGSERLAARRRLHRRRILIALSVLALAALGAIVYGLWQAPVRISRVVMYGTDQSLAGVALEAMQGSSFGIPNDSTFFIPKSRIRARIMGTNSGIAAVSIFRNGFTGLSIRVDYRTAIARWCGLAPTEGVDEYCYVFDANGFIFAAAATTTETVNGFALYAPLVGDTLEPLHATLTRADQLPSVFDFARKLVTLGSPVTKVILKDDEINDVLASGTRLTYVIGSEEQAYTALVSARADLNLADGSVDYVDLRFPGKVYVKKVEAPE